MCQCADLLDNIIFLCLFPDEATTLFRATTLASTLMEQYMKATATPFVHHALKDTILKVMESKQSCEVQNSTFLTSLLRQMYKILVEFRYLA